MVVVVSTYVLLGFVLGNYTADDGRWAAVFLSNFHFESIGTNYLTALRAPSPLQNYWSLSVEEQFYVVYPTLFLLVAGLKHLWSLRVRLTVMLVAVIAGSYWLSVIQTSTHPSSAYFSPFTRAWELALGALVAVSTPWLRQVPTRLAAVLTWAGLAAIAYAAVVFNATTAYPGSLVAIPVAGAALVIAGGVAIPTGGAETVLGLGPCRWLGKLSYSLYLWHWPILILAAEYTGKSALPVGENLLLVLVAVAISMVTFRLIENPVRHARLTSRKSVAMGLTLVVATVIFLSLMIASQTTSAPAYRVVPAANEQVVLGQVAAAPHITSLPANLQPSLTSADTDFVGYGGTLHYACAGTPPTGTSRVPLCAFGDPSGSKLMIAYGDSHALMWVPALNGIAVRDHWRLIVLAKYFCPAELVTVSDPPDFGSAGGPFAVCDKWHRWAVSTINRLRPNLVVIAQESLYTSPATATTPEIQFDARAWSDGLTRLIEAINLPASSKVFIGNVPVLAQAGPDCLARNRSEVQACSTPLPTAAVPLTPVERSVIAAVGAQYIDPTPWLCSAALYCGDQPLHGLPGPLPHHGNVREVPAERLGHATRPGHALTSTRFHRIARVPYDDGSANAFAKTRSRYRA